MLYLCFDKQSSDCCVTVNVNQLSVSLPPQAQVCLASVYSQEPVRDESKSVRYLKMAAKSGVSTLLDASRVLSVALSPSLPVHHLRESPPSPALVNSLLIEYASSTLLQFC